MANDLNKNIGDLIERLTKVGKSPSSIEAEAELKARILAQIESIRGLQNEHGLPNVKNPDSYQKYAQEGAALSRLERQLIGKQYGPAGMRRSINGITQSNEGRELSFEYQGMSYGDRNALAQEEQRKLFKHAQELQTMSGKTDRFEPNGIIKESELRADIERGQKAIAGINVANRQDEMLGLDPKSQEDRITKTYGRARDLIGSNKMTSQWEEKGKIDVNVGGEVKSLGQKDIFELLNKKSQELVDVFDKLKNSAKNLSEQEKKELDEKRSQLAGDVGALEDAAGVARGGGGGGGWKGKAGRYAIAGAQGVAGLAMLAGETGRELFVNQKMQQLANSTGYAQIENQKYELYKAARKGDVMASLQLMQTDEAQKFAGDIRANARVSDYLAAGGKAASGLIMAGAGAAATLKTAGLAAPATLAMAGYGANMAVSGATDLVGAYKGIKSGQSELAAYQAFLASSQQNMQVKAEQMQLVRDMFVNADVISQGLGSNIGGKFIDSVTNEPNRIRDKATNAANAQQFRINDRFSRKSAQMALDEALANRPSDYEYSTRNDRWGTVDKFISKEGMARIDQRRQAQKDKANGIGDGLIDEDRNLMQLKEAATTAGTPPNTVKSRGLLDVLDDNNIGPEEYSRLAAMSVQTMGRDIIDVSGTPETNERYGAASNVFDARRLEKLKLGSMQENVQRQAQLFQAGGQNPSANLESVIAAGMTKSLSDAPSIKAMVDNTAAISRASTGTAAGFDMTGITAAQIAAGIRDDAANKPMAAQVAASNLQLANQWQTNTSTTFSGMFNTARLQEQLSEFGVSGTDAIAIGRREASYYTNIKQMKTKKEKVNALFQIGVGATEDNVDEMLERILDSKLMQTLEAGGATGAMGGLSKEIIEKVRKGQKLNKDEQFQVNKIAGILHGSKDEDQLMGMIAGVKVGANTGGIKDTRSPEDKKRDEVQDTLRTDQQKRDAQAAKTAMEQMAEFGGALAIFSDMLKKVGGEEGKKHEEKFQKAAEQAATDFKAGASIFEKSVTAFEGAVKGIPGYKEQPRQGAREDANAQKSVKQGTGPGG